MTHPSSKAAAKKKKEIARIDAISHSKGMHILHSLKTRRFKNQHSDHFYLMNNTNVCFPQRSWWLLLIGLSLNSLGGYNQLETYRMPGVLQRFAITYLVVALAMLPAMVRQPKLPEVGKGGGGGEGEVRPRNMSV